MNNYIMDKEHLLDWELYKNVSVRIVYIHLYLKSNVLKGGVFFRNYKSLSQDVGIAESKIKKSLKILKEKRYIKIENTFSGGYITLKRHKYIGEDHE